MMGIVLLLIALIGPMLLLSTFLYFRFPDESVGRMDRYIPPLTSALATWAFCTGWLWFYLFNLYISLPVLVLAIGLQGYAISKNLNPKLRRINAILIGASFGMGILSYFYFDV
ncbi:MULTISPECIES: hypothetical protein [Flagellimonas]|uniref:Uncharacterized protein n=1 Tax=Flagellimonas hadalis TaxID=2597517 RepID=A0A5N5IRX7_9FLAO|nr:hypothetical protein [Allomuricauda hadalis]KAB5488190.1 hypothetical protein FOT42_010210 [Allomuricauda hadalis]RUA19567.1 MAG: hypothetical protein DSY83_00180 [Flavobacteriia bacterium]